MKVEIWSDVMCPFCYIGKRRFESALKQLSFKDSVVIEWKSFELDPYLQTDPSKSVYQHLSEKKGWSMAQTIEISKNVVNMAKECGLEYHFEKAVVANSFDAHRLSHLAKKYNKQDLLEEKLFEAYFTKGLNTADHKVLLAIGTEIGLEENIILEVLNSKAFSEEVRNDEMQAQKLGIRGVPFFVVDNKYGISGAQEVSTFKQALEQAYKEWLTTAPSLESIGSNTTSCTPEGCE